MAYTLEEIGRQVVVAAKSVRAADPGALGDSMQVLLEDNNWRSYIDPADRREHEWDDFRRFVRERLRTTVEQLEVALHNAPRLAAHVRDLASAPVGRPKINSQATNKEGSSSQTRGTAYRMRRLLKERPDLAAEVEQNGLSVRAAYTAAGWAKPTAEIPIDTAAHALKALSRRFTLQELRDGLDELCP